MSRSITSTRLQSVILRNDFPRPKIQNGKIKQCSARIRNLLFVTSTWLQAFILRSVTKKFPYFLMEEKTTYIKHYIARIRNLPSITSTLLQSVRVRIKPNHSPNLKCKTKKPRKNSTWHAPATYSLFIPVTYYIKICILHDDIMIHVYNNTYDVPFILQKF